MKRIVLCICLLGLLVAMEPEDLVYAQPSDGTYAWKTGPLDAPLGDYS